jgi:RNA recognition motif. (a.k.a. RRM, RBD, or RNP domain)
LYSAKEIDVERYFSEFGHVVDVAIMRDKHSGRSRGFAFVTFRERTRQRAEALQQAMLRPKRPHCLQGRNVEIRASDGSKPPDSFLDRQKASSSDNFSTSNKRTY